MMVVAVRTFLVLSAALLLACVTATAHAQPLPDSVGFVNRFDVRAAGHTFEVETKSNFHIRDIDFDGEQKRLTFYITSGTADNLAEIIIPRPLLGGNLTFSLDGVGISPGVASDERISFVTLNLTGPGDAVLDILGTTHLEGLAGADPGDQTSGQGQGKEQEPQELDDARNSGPQWDSSVIVYACLATAAIAAAIAGSVIAYKRRNRNLQEGGSSRTG